MSTEPEQTVAPTPAWPFAIAAALLLMLTWYLFGLYGIVHWHIRPAVFRSITTEVTELHGESLAETNRASLSSERVRESEKAVEDLAIHRITLMNRLEIYRLSGLAAFLCSIISVFRKPRWVGIMGMVFGIAGLWMAAVKM